MRVLVSWTGSRREPYMFRGGVLSAGTHLQVLRDSQFAGTFQHHYLLSVPETLEDAEAIVRELASLGAPCPTDVLCVPLADPTDHDQIAAALARALKEIHRTHPLLKNELWVLLNTGTPQMQSVWLLLTAQGVIAARLIQSSPPSLARASGSEPVREFAPDLEAWRRLFD